METPEFAQVKEANGEAAIPFVTMIRDYPSNVIAGMGTRTIDGVFFNIFADFSIGYLAETVKIPRTAALFGVTASALLLCATIAFFGWLSDGLGRTRVYAIGSLVTGLSAFPAHVRYTGISFVYQFSGIFTSRLTPIIATALLQYLGTESPWLV